MRPRLGALFAGYGGIELALHDVLNAEPAWFSEFDKAPSRILEHRFPGVPNHGDITKVRWEDVEPVDIITGGSPCQDLSHAGKRKGMRPGTRSGLWASMCDAIDIIRPSLVVWENVRGAYSASAAPGPLESCDLCVGDGREPSLRALGRVVGDLAELGYDAAWVGIRAADVGAPHGRFRVFVLAWPQGDAAALTWPQGDAAALTWPQGDAAALLPTPAVNDMGASYTPETWDAWTERMQAKHGNGNGHGASLSIEALRLLPPPRTSDTNGAGVHGTGGLDLRTAVSLLPTPTAADAKGSGGKAGSADVTLTDATERGALRGIDFGQYAPAIARWEAALGRPAPAPTEPTGKGSAHRLSPRFVEFMMGLPDGWVTEAPGLSRNDQLKALGNGVVPQQCAAAVQHLLNVKETTP